MIIKRLVDRDYVGLLEDGLCQQHSAWGSSNRKELECVRIGAKIIQSISFLTGKF
jgi:hypothetical protein